MSSNSRLNYNQPNADYDSNSQADSLILEGHNEHEGDPQDEETKTEDDPIANNPGFMVRKTKIGIEISPLEDMQITARSTTGHDLQSPQLDIENNDLEVIEDEDEGYTKKSSGHS